jgi:glycosyltransferase involved in cell wall biosynthesis
MRVAIFTDSWFPRIDGLTTSVRNIIGSLERRGHTFHVFCPGPVSERTDGVTRYRGRPFRGYPDFHIAFREKEHDTVRLLTEGGFDLVHIQSPFLVGLWGLRAANRAKLPVVTSYHTFIPDLVPYVIPFGLRAASRRAVWRLTGSFFRRCDIVLAPSPSCASELANHVPGHKIPNLQVHPNGVDVGRFVPSARSSARRREMSPNGGPVVLSLGRLAREKDLPFLVEAFSWARRQIPDLHLAIAGKGPERDRIERAVAKHGVQGAVSFLGFVADEELAATYASADAFASASQFETQGMTAVEAMACGTPVAAVRARGLADFVRHRETGYLFEPWDTAGAATALVRAVRAGPVLRKECRTHAETLSLERSADQLERIYIEALEGEPSPSWAAA